MFKARKNYYEKTDLQLFPVINDRPLDDDDREETYNSSNNHKL